MKERKGGVSSHSGGQVVVRKWDEREERRYFIPQWRTGGGKKVG